MQKQVVLLNLQLAKVFNLPMPFGQPKHDYWILNKHHSLSQNGRYGRLQQPWIDQCK
jgi:hypothetical protein